MPFIHIRTLPLPHPVEVVPREQIFIHPRSARSGHVYDGGEVVSW